MDSQAPAPTTQPDQPERKPKRPWFTADELPQAPDEMRQPPSEVEETLFDSADQ